MKDPSKTKQALIREVTSLRERIAELEQSESEHKRMDDVLRLRSEILANMLEGVQLTRVDDGAIVYANPRFENMFGYDPGELVGKHVSIINAPGEKTPEEVANEISHSLKQTRVWNGEVRNIRKDGTSFWCYAHVSTFHHPQFGEVWIAVHQDITKRKKVEEALRAANAYNRSLIEASIDPLVTISPDGKITDVNAATERVTGYTRDILIGTDFSNYFSDPEVARVGYHRVFTEGHVRDYPLEIRHCDGRVTPVLYNATLYHNEKGEVSGIFAAARDITERRVVEARLYASLREKEILLREVHHRVKNNMQVISGLLDLQASSSKNPELVALFQESRSRIQAMALVHEKLYETTDFARIAMTGYVRTISQQLFQSYKINPGKIDLIIQTDGDVYVDINKAIPCGLILNELISNALKHAFPGDRQGELQIIIGETKNTAIEIVIRDNGIGLPEDVDPHQPGSVGLHLVNGLVTNQLDGQIEVRRDAGTEFRIRFPL